MLHKATLLTGVIYVYVLTYKKKLYPYPKLLSKHYNLLASSEYQKELLVSISPLNNLVLI